MDIVIGSVGLIILALLFPFIALGIKMSSSGPVLYRQQRTGFRGRTFECLKFRTMHSMRLTSRNGQPVVTKKGDVRIFWFGQLLRKLNLDELPQLINVMRGEMSLVGPRPYPLEECSYWSEVFEDHYYRYLMVPGITGYAQAKGYRGGTLDENHMRKRLDYDLIYTEKNSLLMDLLILFKTCLQMIRLKTKAH